MYPRLANRNSTVGKKCIEMPPRVRRNALLREECPPAKDPNCMLFRVREKTLVQGLWCALFGQA